MPRSRLFLEKTQARSNDKGYRTCRDGLGWEMAATTPDHIIGTLNLRAHQTVVDIAYDTKSYNIRYKSSMGLLYGEVDQTSGQETRVES
jgi:hypothetical protein